MEVTTINAILQILVSILLIWYVIKNHKLTQEYNEEIEESNRLKQRVENSVYNIEDLTGSERPVLDFDLTIRDILEHREKATRYDNMKSEYEKLVLEYPQMEKELQDREIKICELEKKLEVNETSLEHWKKSYEETKRLYENNGRSLREYVENNYENFDKLAKALDIPFSKGKVIVLEDFTEKNKKMFVAIGELSKRNFDLIHTSEVMRDKFFKRIHVKDQELYTLRKRLGIKPRKKTGQNKINK